MGKALGIGGIFFRSVNPEALATWYDKHLGINPVPTSLETAPWQTEAGVTVLSPFARDTDYFPAKQQYMINFRVDDLDEILVELRSAGIKVLSEEAMEGLGRFAHISDPEGNAVELWEPA